MFKFYLDKRILVGFILALTILSWLAVSSYLNTQRLIKSSSMVTHTLDVLYHVEHALAIATGIEIGQRGYSLTGKKEFLDPYNKARNEIDFHLGNLESLTADNPSQQDRIRALRRSMEQLLEFSSNAVTKRAASFEEARALNASLEGKRLLDEIRLNVAEIQREENRLLSIRTQENEGYQKRFNYGFVSLIAITGIVLLTTFYSLEASSRAKHETQKRLKSAYDQTRDLYDNAPCGYHSLDEKGTFIDINKTLLSWLGYNREEVIGKLNIRKVIAEKDIGLFESNFRKFKLEKAIYDVEFDLIRKDGTEFPVVLNAVLLEDEKGNFIKSRSTTFDNTNRKLADEKIKNLNKELEAFTYSVSHDLRAPLRSIDGYSRILQEDYSQALDDEGKRVISVILNNARRMGKLIDDLLDFARLGRRDVSHAKLNMTQIVKSVAEELLEDERRYIDLQVEALQPAVGDVDMIRQVWQNLLSNAIKYTGKTANPTIAVSSFSTQDGVGYKISDNGVGFDMQYAPKLFGVFQRLHKMQDFSGTGVGLAIVKRIIDRHEGKVWAEAKINEGATFYFTIPNVNGNQ